MARTERYSNHNKYKKIRYFSEELKRRIVGDLEQGIFTVREASREYEVSRPAVYKWLYKYSRYAKRQERVIVESKSHTSKIKAMQERIKELERIIGQKQLLIDFKDKMIEIAEEQYKVDIKKKFDSKFSSGTGSIETNTDTK
jgi:transposase